MMQRLRNSVRPVHTLHAWRRGEAGMGEAATAIFVIPFMIALIFVLIEVGWNLRYRGMVDQVVQDTVRGIAQDGAEYWPATSSLPINYNGVNYAQASRGWESLGQARLQELCLAGSNSMGRCTAPPQMTCTVVGSTNPAGAREVAPTAGSQVTCTATFNYRNIAGFMTNNRFMNLGFGAVYSQPFVQRVTGATIVGRN